MQVYHFNTPKTPPYDCCTGLQLCWGDVGGTAKGYKILQRLPLINIHGKIEVPKVKLPLLQQEIKKLFHK